jgi:hypothetical protein
VPGEVSSCGFVDGKNPRLCFELSVGDPLELQLTQDGRVIAPSGDAALFDTKGLSKLLLGAVVVNRFVCSHIQT